MSFNFKLVLLYPAAGQAEDKIIMKAKSIKGRSTEEISSALTESMAHGYKPTLAIVFISVKQDREAISKLLDEKGIQIFGATTAGEFIDGEIEEGSIVVMLLDMNPAYFKMEFLETSQETAFEDANKLGITFTLENLTEQVSVDEAINLLENCSYSPDNKPHENRFNELI